MVEQNNQEKRWGDLSTLTLLMLMSLFLVACGISPVPVPLNSPTPVSTVTVVVPSPSPNPTSTPIPSPTPVPPTPTLDKGVQDPQSGHWYLVLDPMTWDQAVRSCANKGGHLAVIDTGAEDNFVYTRLAKPDQADGKDFLLGATDRDQEGHWIWATGEIMKYTNWANGEPNNCGNSETYGKCMPENGLAYNSKFPGMWNDVPMQGESEYLCEFES